jgi:hypothetical protein
LNSQSHPKGPHSTNLLTFWKTNCIGVEEGWDMATFS